MKVRFKYGIRTYSGTLDEMVYGSFRRHRLCIGRVFVFPRLTEQNASMGAICRNLAKLYHEADAGYLEDLKVYAVRNERNTHYSQLVPTAFAIFIKLMFAWQKSDPEFVDLSAVTLEDIVTHESPVLSIKDTVDTDLLRKVDGYETLDTPMG